MARAIDGELLELEIANIANKLAKSDAQKALMGRVMYYVEHMPTLTPQNEWVSVEERLPELPEKDWCSKMVISCDKNGHVAPMIWERAQVRGKMIERWKYHWDRIYDGAGITHWMPLPAPPGEGNNVPNEAPNEPLTLEQLREMDGQPVWDSSLRCWGIVKSEKDSDVFLQTKSGEFGLDPLGRVKIYRRPPEGEA